MQETQVQSLGRDNTLEKEMVMPCNILAWKISWTEKPGGLQFMGLQKSQTRLSNQHRTTSPQGLAKLGLTDSGMLVWEGDL